MKEKIRSFFHGTVRIEVKGESVERFVNLCRSNGIYIWDIRNQEICKICISIEDFFRLKSVIKKTGVKIRIIEKYGIPFLLYRYRKRKMFVAGICTSFLLIYLLSLFIWDLEVEGNYSYSDNEIMKFLEANRIYPGMKKREVHCDDIEKAIRNQYFDITWVSVEVTGTRLIVHIRENEEELTETQQKQESSEGQNAEGYDLVAAKDAEITGVVMRSGTPAVKAGMEVKAGDMLVYGHYDVVNDSQEVVRTQYLTADADIYGKVVYFYEYQMPLTYQKKIYDEKQRTAYSLRFGKKLFQTLFQKKENEEMVTEEEQIALYGDFYLPVSVLKHTYTNYKLEEQIYSEEQAKNICEEKLAYFLEKLEKNTIQIVENNVTIEMSDDICLSSGSITVIENIGQQRKAVIEEITGETENHYE